MVLSNRTKIIRSILVLWLVYCTFCSTIVFKLNLKIFIHDFSKEGTSEWFFRDLAYVLGLIILPLCFTIREEQIRRRIMWIFIIDGSWELIDLLILNNIYDPYGTIIQNIILVYSLYTLFRKPKIII